MFKIIGRVVKGIFKGVRDILPVAQVGDAARELLLAKVRDRIDSGRPADEIVMEVLDILDDGKINQSFDEKKAEMIGRIVAGGFPVLAYLAYGIATGDWSFIF